MVSDDPLREDKDPVPPELIQTAYRREQASTRRAPATHELKTWPGPFDAVLRGDKLFEWRKFDRDFVVGDLLELDEWDPLDGASHHNPTIGYTGRRIVARITYICTSFGVPEGYCVLGIKVLSTKVSFGE